MDIQNLVARMNFLTGMAEGIKWVIQEAEKEKRTEEQKKQNVEVSPN